jgi:hypothetical protein
MNGGEPIRRSLCTDYLDQHFAYLRRQQVGVLKFPVEHVVLQETISWLEKKIIEYCLIFQNVKSIENVKALLLGQDQSCFVHLSQAVFARNDVVAVGSIQILVVAATKDR